MIFDISLLFVFDADARLRLPLLSHYDDAFDAIAAISSMLAASTSPPPRHYTHFLYFIFSIYAALLQLYH
jgi:hypothetical protein